MCVGGGGGGLGGGYVRLPLFFVLKMGSVVCGEGVKLWVVGVCVVFGLGLGLFLGGWGVGGGGGGRGRLGEDDGRLHSLFVLTVGVVSCFNTFFLVTRSF